MESRHIALLLPDLPRWVEVRAALLDGRGELLGFREHPSLSFVLRDPAGDLMMVVGAAEGDVIRAAAAALRPDAEVICAPEDGDGVARALPAWRRTRAVLHRLRDPSRLPPARDPDARLLEPGEIDAMDGLPDDLRRELLDIEAEGAPVAAVFVESRAASFCYPGSVTEMLWDVSIDTLPEFRRRGLAGRCVARMMRHMWILGREPVWGALVENPASWRLALKLGFEPVDELALFQAPPRGREDGEGDAG